MGFFDFLKQPGIDQGIQEYESTPEAILLDVRTPQEYKEGHIPGRQYFRQERSSCFCLLPFRKQKRPGSRDTEKDGIHQCEKYRRYRLIHRKGGAIV